MTDSELIERAFDGEIIGDGKQQVELLCRELSKWRDVGKRLWPFCRFFGLFGGSLESILAAADLAKLLGHGTQSDATQHAASEAAAATVEQIADWIEESNWIRRMAPDSRDKFLQELRGLVNE